MTAPCKVKNIVDDGKILLVNTAQAVVNSVEELSEHLDCPKNIKFVNPEDLVSFPHAHSKFLLVPVKLMALGKVQKCLMQEDNEYRREFLGTIEFRNTSYFVYKPASANEKHSSVKRIMDSFLNMSIGRIVTLLLSYFVIFELITALVSMFPHAVFRSNWFSVIISIVSLMLGLIGTDWCQARLKYHSLVGYWKYYDEPKATSDTYPSAYVRADATRIVRTRFKGNNLYIEGYRIIDGKCRKHFSSKLTEIQYLDAEKKTGILFYWFKGLEQGFGDGYIDGFCALQWDKSSGCINELKGYYAGIKSESLGGVFFRRISQQEYDAFKKIGA